MILSLPSFDKKSKLMLISVIALFILNTVLLAVQNNIGILSDFTTFYVSAHLFYSGEATYKLALLGDLKELTPSFSALLNEFPSQKLTQYFPPNTPPLFYILYAPIFLLPFKVAAIVSQLFQIGLCLFVGKKLCDHYKIDYFWFLAASIFSAALTSNIKLGQIGLLTCAIAGSLLLPQSKKAFILKAALLIGLKPFFGVILPVLFINKLRLESIKIGILALALLIVPFFIRPSFDFISLGWSDLLGYKEILSSNLPVQVTLNNSITGIVSNFLSSDGPYRVIIIFILIAAICTNLFYNPNLKTALVSSLILSPLALSYYGLLAVWVLLIAAHTELTSDQTERKKLILLGFSAYMLANIPINMFVISDESLFLIQDWVIFARCGQLIGLLLVLKLITYNKKESDINVR